MSGFDMSGHRVSFRAPNDHEAAFGTDVVVEGEDMAVANIALCAYEGGDKRSLKVVGQSAVTPPEAIEKYAQAAKLVTDALELEQAAG